jgi:hypothetical protein
MFFRPADPSVRSPYQDHTKWTNPLEIELPRAPHMRIYCLYGHGKETERSYWYAKGPYQSGPNNAEGNALPVRLAPRLPLHHYTAGALLTFAIRAPLGRHADG